MSFRNLLTLSCSTSGTLLLTLHPLRGNTAFIGMVCLIVTSITIPNCIPSTRRLMRTTARLKKLRER